MVKQSRRQVKKRSLRRRTAKKRVMKRRAMKGGEYVEPTELNVEANFNRKVDETTLYKLTSKKIQEKDRQNNDITKIQYTLDFSVYNGGMFMNMFIRPGVYIDALIKGLNVKQDVDKANIEALINKLFEGGIDMVKQRKLVITEPALPESGSAKQPNKMSATIEITGVNIAPNTKVIIQTPNARFASFLTELGDGIMPITPITPA